MKLLTWTNGRQNSGYRAFTLIYSERFNLDCYILEYKVGSKIPIHRDTVIDSDHYRLNWEFWKAKIGGEFRGKTIWSLFDRVHFFRPDLEEHEVTEIKRGVRYVFSIGKSFNHKKIQ